MSEHEKILILGGTKEAAKLANQLVAEGHFVTTSLAGRTKHPAPLEGEIRIGGFSSETMTGTDGLATYLADNRFTRLIDATHPFAKKISENAANAARLTGIAFEKHQREPWNRVTGDNWIDVSSIEQAVEAIPSSARVFLALGSQHIAPFAARQDVFYLVRMVDKPTEPLALQNHQLVLGRPSDDPEAEAALLKEHHITHIVCRNSGGEGAYAKITAARKLGLPVIMIGR